MIETTSATTAAPRRWYSGVTGYQWLVHRRRVAGLDLRCVEGQLYNITRGEMLRTILRHAHPELAGDAVAGGGPRVGASGFLHFSDWRNDWRLAVQLARG
jgi:hypothetical protein